MQRVHELIACIPVRTDKGSQNQVGRPGILPCHQRKRNKACRFELLIIAHEFIPGLRRLDSRLFKHFLVVKVTDILLLVAYGPDLSVPGIGSERRFPNLCFPFRVLVQIVIERGYKISFNQDVIDSVLAHDDIRNIPGDGQNL
ncbi:hypothetical protein D3C73_745780 [compost metagenome]